jgi:hypothetical protein
MTAWPRALVIAAWIGSILSGALAAMLLIWAAAPLYWSASTIDRSAGTTHWQGYVLIAWVVLACLLLLPPLWTKRSKTIAYARVAAGFALLFGAMFMPIQTHAVMVEIPRPAATTK